MARKKKKQRPVYRKTRPLVKTAMTNLVGIGLIGATSSMHSKLPAGTAKTITGIVPGLQATALVGENLKLMKKERKRRRKRK